MDIGRLDGVSGPGRIEGRKLEGAQPLPPAATPRVPDKAELSGAAQLASQVLALPDVRSEKVTEFRRLIAAGLYQTDERLLGALDKFRAELRGH